MHEFITEPEEQFTRWGCEREVAGGVVCRARGHGSCGWGVGGVMDEEEEGIILILIIMYATHTLHACISANTYLLSPDSYKTATLGCYPYAIRMMELMFHADSSDLVLPASRKL